jgi:hypothetical protein
MKVVLTSEDPALLHVIEIAKALQIECTTLDEIDDAEIEEASAELVAAAPEAEAPAAEDAHHA